MSRRRVPQDRSVVGTEPDASHAGYSDTISGEINLHGATVRYSHPRAGSDLLFEMAEPDLDFPPYWADVWPSGIELAHAVSARALAGVRVLELGCGLGLPGIAAALNGARVLATDRSGDALAYTQSNAVDNGVSVETAQTCWTQPKPLLDRAPWQLVMAADVLYEQRHVNWLLELLPELVDDTGEVWIADPQRLTAQDFLARAAPNWSIATSATRLPMVDIHRLTRRQPTMPTD